LIDDPHGASTHHNGFDADVALNTFTGNLFQTAAHEVAHTMGLPHIIEGKVDNEPRPFYPADWALISKDDPIYGNLMFPGFAPKELRGGKILESQIHNIIDDSKASPSSRLNKEGESGKGSNVLWGNSPRDTPAYKFFYASYLKRQILVPRE
jgi:hypothetical protein